MRLNGSDQRFPHPRTMDELPMQSSQLFQHRLQEKWATLEDVNICLDVTNNCDMQTYNSPVKCSQALFLNNAGVVSSQLEADLTDCFRSTPHRTQRVVPILVSTSSQRRKASMHPSLSLISIWTPAVPFRFSTVSTTRFHLLGR